MKTFIVITSINQPTEAVEAFAKLNGPELIVVSDRKTPLDWYCNNVDLLTIDLQNKLTFALTPHLPFDHYCRKMLGYLKAIEQGAELIIDADDDNIPKVGWRFPEFDQMFGAVAEDNGFVNIYQLFTKKKIWPRGMPLGLINTNFELEKKLIIKKCNVGIWQGLADEDPDVDAIYRFTNDTPCYFEKRDPVVLGRGTICPFNTQNTLIRKELFPLLYLPTYVTFRFTDILRGLVAQPIMWAHGYQLGFTHANVIQRRNPHDTMKDFVSELPMYQHVERVIEVVSASLTSNASIGINLHNAYRALLKEAIMIDKEMITLEAWLKDIGC